MIAAMILAAGQSKRMGRPKMSLPWGQSTVLGRVIQVFKAAGIEDIVVVTGGDREAAEEIAAECQARTAFNPDFERDEMLSSIQTGLHAMDEGTRAVFIALGDQPQIQEATVRLIAEEYARSPVPLIVPSYQMRRGHPWLVEGELWPDILELRSPKTPRDFLRQHADAIRYVEVDNPSILQDLDTPEDYLKASA